MSKILPLITIIVPVYNGAKYLGDCINSIVNQDYLNLEIIIVDDGSTDNSLSIIHSYAAKDRRIKVIQQKNSGVSSARNNALINTHGEYVSFVDQDDCIAMDYVTYFYNMIIEHSAEIALTPKARRFTSDISRIEKCSWNGKDRIEVVSGEKAAIMMLCYNIVIGPWNKLISFELIKKNKLYFNTDFFGGEGFAFSIECMLRANKIAIGHNEVYYYRVDNPNSGTTRFSMKMIESNINAQKYIRESITKVTPELTTACKYANWHTYCDCFNMIIGCRVKSTHKALYREIRKVCRKDALCGLRVSIPLKEKIKGLVYFINPDIAAYLINRFRIRKFTVESENVFTHF